MADFALPHDHGRHKHDEALHRELMNTERFRLWRMCLSS